MTDLFTIEKRSEIMSKIRKKDTKIEIEFRKILWNKGFRYRIDYKNLIGRPDIVFKSKKIAIFIDGCFWHKCLTCYKEPKSNKSYWLPKIENNLKKDIIVNNKLREEGWIIIRIWEHELKKKNNLEKKANEIIENYLIE